MEGKDVPHVITQNPTSSLFPLVEEEADSIALVVSKVNVDRLRNDDSWIPDLDSVFEDEGRSTILFGGGSEVGSDLEVWESGDWKRRRS